MTELTTVNISSNHSIKILPGLFLVGFLWGTTNPFIKKGSTCQLDTSKENSQPFLSHSAVLKLFKNLKFFLPLLINYLGSIVFYILLSSYDLKLVVPLANSLSFLFTSITESFLNKSLPSYETIGGTFLIVIGTLICITS